MTAGLAKTRAMRAAQVMRNMMRTATVGVI
jgi:hypothetical protein